MAGTLFVVATPIGNLEDITTRALRVLREVAVIAAEDTRRTARLLARYAIQTPTTSLHEHNEHVKGAALIARLQRGDSLALVSDAGTPGISDPGQRLIRRAVEGGIRIEPIPGPNAAVAALSVSGFDTDRFLFLGFPPTRPQARKLWMAELAEASGTVVFYEAPHRIHDTLGELRALIGDIDIVIGRELTKSHEELVRGPISLAIQGLKSSKGEFTIVLNIGRLMDKIPDPPTDDDLLFREFCELTENSGSNRRDIVAALAERHQLTPNRVKAAVERVRKYVK
jgi:16S rRNA (cytidine1402-2'-O)-methyltransferase